MEQKIKRITEFLYLKSINESSRKITHPCDNKDIEKKIVNISIDVNVPYNQITVRVRFNGAKAYYLLGIEANKYTYWTKVIEQFIIQKPDLEMSLLDTVRQEEPQQIEYIEEAEEDDPFNTI